MLHYQHVMKNSGTGISNNLEKGFREHFQILFIEFCLSILLRDLEISKRQVTGSIQLISNFFNCFFLMVSRSS